MKNKVICSNCNGEHIKKDGKRKTENRGLIQRYKCLECSHRFVVDDGFFRMKNNPQKITCAIDLFYRGVSTRKVQEHLGVFYSHNASHKSVYKWIVKYANKISNFTNKLKLQVGEEVQVDEMQYNRRLKNNQKGVGINWFIDSIDTKTRFMVASEFVEARDKKEIKEVLTNIKDRTQGKVQIITTDGHAIYQNAVKKAFGYNQITKKYSVLHNVVNASNGEGFNIVVERLHNSIRARTKTFRGFHGSVYSANSIMKGYEVYYNFITKHQAIGVCPFELATDLKLNGVNKWLELIKLSSF